MDKNIVILEGIIGEDAKYGKTQEGKEYFTFSLQLNSFIGEMADSTEKTHSQTYVRVFCYDKRQLAYLRKVDAKSYQRAFVFGRLSSFKNEYKGISYITNSIVCRDISILKTRKETTTKEQ